ncbi:MAG: hypothetical protein QXZ44_03115 [Ferroplasma sp.]
MAYIMFPKNIILKNNVNTFINREKAQDESCFSLLVPESKTVDIVDYLKKNKGFSNASPSFDHGEDYSISTMIKAPWELHMRLYLNSYFPGYSRIKAHVEIARKYLQHLNFSYVHPVVYEPFRYYRDVFNEFIVAYNLRYMVESVLDNYWFRIASPDILTPWHPSIVVKSTFNYLAGQLKGHFKKM